MVSILLFLHLCTLKFLHPTPLPWQVAFLSRLVPDRLASKPEGQAGVRAKYNVSFGDFRLETKDWETHMSSLLYVYL